MSHTVSVTTAVTNEAHLRAAAAAVQAEILGVGRHQVYSSQHTGFGVKLRDWRHPVVFDFNAKTVKYDNYGGSWGDIARFDELTQQYNAAVTEEQMRLEGFPRMQERVLADGTIEREYMVPAG